MVVQGLQSFTQIKAIINYLESIVPSLKVKKKLE